MRSFLRRLRQVLACVGSLPSVEFFAIRKQTTPILQSITDATFISSLNRL